MTEADILAEGRKRLRASVPWLTDAQFDAWVASARKAGAEFALTPDGCVARYERPSPVTRHVGPPTNVHELERT